MLRKLLEIKKKLPKPKDEATVGGSHPKYNSDKLALGISPFVADIKFPGMLFGVLKFSDHPRAKVISINIHKAEKIPGVIKVFTANDIPGERFSGLIVPDWPLMIEAGEETRYVGDVIAGVVAESEEIARRGS